MATIGLAISNRPKLQTGLIANNKQNACLLDLIFLIIGIILCNTFDVHLIKNVHLNNRINRKPA